MIEVRPPVEWDKGKIVDWLIEEISSRQKSGVLGVYFGDDQTDEDAFRALAGRGITVWGGEETGETLAEYSASGVGEVSLFLREILALT